MNILRNTDLLSIPVHWETRKIRNLGQAVNGVRTELESQELQLTYVEELQAQQVLHEYVHQGKVPVIPQTPQVVEALSQVLLE